MSDSDGTKGPVLVHGIPVASGAKPGIRREIRDLKVNYPKQFDLYLLGLEKFQQVEESKPLSYFEISGIHGQPYRRWPDQGWNNMKGAQEYGFCTHSSILFLTWHRPYLALFEAELYKHVQNVAKEYTEAQGRNEYIEAAKSFRMPYWDWALPWSDQLKDIFPQDALSSGRVEINRPKTGKSIMQPTPLYQYEFRNTDPKYRPDAYPDVKTTIRYPASRNEVQGDKDMQASLLQYFNQPDRNMERNLTERVVYLLQSYERYGPMSHNSFNAGHPELYGSLEDTHNTFHVRIGRGGHMNHVAVSAFDPIFWLHHTNIDRLFAIWQGLHDSGDPSTWIERSRNLDSVGTWTTLRGGWEDKTTPLTPFNRTNTEYWTSDGVKETVPFGYGYPETQSWEYLDKEAFKNSIKRKIKDLYRVGSLATAVASKSASVKTELASRAKVLLAAEKTEAPANAATFVQITQQMAAVPVEAKVMPDAAPIDMPKLPSNRKLDDLVNDDDTYLEWLTNLKAQKHTLDGKYSVHIFLGPAEETHPYLWGLAPNHVGTFAPLGQAANTACGKCQQDQAEDTQVTGQIPLTIALTERYLAGQLESIKPEHVVPYLQKNLHWKVVLVDGAEANRGDVADLLVSVVSNKVTLPSNDTDLPHYEPTVTVYPEVTTKVDNETPRGDGTGLTDRTQA